MTFEQFKATVNRFVKDRVNPGHFVSAVLANDLYQAVKYADEESRENLSTFVLWVYNEVPANLCFSYENLRKHIMGG
jgi:hypothetical protein